VHAVQAANAAWKTTSAVDIKDPCQIASVWFSKVLGAVESVDGVAKFLEGFALSCFA
jgi:hypothetical protein